MPQQIMAGSLKVVAYWQYRQRPFRSERGGMAGPTLAGTTQRLTAAGLIGLLGLVAGLCAIVAVGATLIDWYGETTEARWPRVSVGRRARRRDRFGARRRKRTVEPACPRSLRGQRSGAQSDADLAQRGFRHQCRTAASLDGAIPCGSSCRHSLRSIARDQRGVCCGRTSVRLPSNPHRPCLRRSCRGDLRHAAGAGKGLAWAREARAALDVLAIAIWSRRARRQAIRPSASTT